MTSSLIIPRCIIDTVVAVPLFSEPASICATTAAEAAAEPQLPPRYSVTDSAAAAAADSSHEPPPAVVVDVSSSSRGRRRDGHREIKAVTPAASRPLCLSDRAAAFFLSRSPFAVRR